MTTENNGETLSSQKLRKLEEIEGIIQEYENSLVGSPYQNNEFEKFLKLTRQELEKMTDHECFMAAYNIGQQILYIQRKLNKESARVKWCAATLNALVSNRWNNYSEMIKYEIKVNMIIKEDDFLESVNKLKNMAEQRIERLNNITINLKYMSDILTEMGRSKRWEKKNNE